MAGFAPDHQARRRDQSRLIHKVSGPRLQVKNRVYLFIHLVADICAGSSKLLTAHQLFHCSKSHIEQNDFVESQTDSIEEKKIQGLLPLSTISNKGLCCWGFNYYQKDEEST